MNKSSEMVNKLPYLIYGFRTCFITQVVLEQLHLQCLCIAHEELTAKGAENAKDGAGFVHCSLLKTSHKGTKSTKDTKKSPFSPERQLRKFRITNTELTTWHYMQ